MQTNLLNKHHKNKSSVTDDSAMTSHLNLIALGANTHNLGYLITSIIIKNNCTLLKNNIINLGADSAITALIQGKWNQIAKLEKSINFLAKKHDAHIYLKRNNLNEPESSEGYINYLIQAITNNNPKLLKELLNFFYQENININYVNFNANNHNRSLANLEMQVKIPTDLNIMALREKFLTLCDHINLDTNLEPCF